jgi:hypothetical protein
VPKKRCGRPGNGTYSLLSTKDQVHVATFLMKRSKTVLTIAYHHQQSKKINNKSTYVNTYNMPQADNEQ